VDFEWDKKKAWENVKNHDGITFDEATLVFFDDWAIEDFDEVHSDDEIRFVIVGLSGTRLLRVVYTEREKIRIISAQKAQPFERVAYEYARNNYDQ